MHIPALTGKHAKPWFYSGLPAGAVACASPPGTSIRSASGWTTCWPGSSERTPDIVCLQEIKCVDEAFPREAFEALGYNVAVHGQKAFNGVALLSKLPFDEVAPGLIGDDGDVQARFLEALVSTKTGVLRVVSLYLPNGNPPDTR